MSTSGMDRAKWNKVLAKVWRPLAGLAGLVALVAWVGGAFESKVEPGKVEHQAGIALPAGARVCTAAVERAAVRLDVVGVVAAEQRANLSAQIGATVQSVLVSAGSAVSNGQLLATLDDRDALAQVTAAEAQFKQAESERNRTRQLFEKSAATQQALEGAEAAFEAVGARFKQARVMAGYTRIVSPMDGIVTDRRIEPGDLAGPGQPLFSVYDPRRMRLDVPVPVRLIPRVSTQQELEVTLDGVEKPVRGRVAEVVAEVDPLTRTRVVKVRLDPNGLALLPGAFGRIRVETEPVESLWIPASAVRRVGQQELVQVAANGRALGRIVKTGAQAEGRVEILSGLSAGDVVLVEPVRED